MSQENVEAVREWVAAINAGDADRLIELADPAVYLEPHHTRRLSDGGPDDPRWVIALCPNCHRRVHHGADGEDYNNALMDRMSDLEAESASP